MKIMKKHHITGVLALLAAVAISAYANDIFMLERELEPLYPSQYLSEVKMLSDYLPTLKDTPGDTEIYIYRGEKTGGSCLVLGATHANEIGGYMGAVVLMENAKATQGTLYIIPRANRSGLTSTDPGDAAPSRIHVSTPSGVRWFKYGSRATNPMDQWPDPDVYIHASSRQNLSGSEVRNLNRAYPGRPDGNFTERVAYAIAELIRQERIDMTIDLHEASPEYPNNNSTVAHENAMQIAALGMINMQMQGIDIKLEPSPANLHGLSHRELGDYTNTFALLMETPNAAQGRTRGATNERLAVTGQDKCYEILVKYDLLYVPYDENGHPLEERVGRHVQGVREYVAAMSQFYPEKTVVIENIPTYDDFMNGALGDYLH
ncbi:MAG: succinylglutamate desuccinylase [Synergistaceae bacterium]|nr:succinylglutamate desuccinylase [Synergistaceae bacterium]